MAVPAKPLSEISDQAIRLMVRELGAADAARFISQFTMGHGDYTKERKELFEDMTIEDIVQEMRHRRQQND